MPTGSANDRDAYGREWTGRIRARPTWFGFVVLEELCIELDGASVWRKVQGPVIINEVRP
jgi:hypothetical protein